MSILTSLLMGLLPVVMAMPEPSPPGGWGPPLDAPPPDGPGRMLFQEMENMSGPAGGVEQYCELLLQGPAPPEELPWFCRCSSCRGEPGLKGEPGARGPPGSPGSPGRRGLTGFRGPPGFTGRPGVKGQKGDEGVKGDRGQPGFTGEKGGRGFKGDKGDPGLEGRPGEQGPKGDEGVCPESCESSSSPPGLPGLPGPSGPRGLPGSPGPMGSQGLKGDKGGQGAPGEAGLEGQKGEPGPPGDCSCVDGEQGAQGSKGSKGDQGQRGSPGQQGPQGEPGPMGLGGPPGPCMPLIQSAFSAGLESSYPPPNAPVVFSLVLFNLQGAYDPQTGLYSAPVNGTYVFSFHLTVFERVLKVGLFHNFRPVVITTDPKVLGTTSHSVVLHLAQGDQVWLQVKDSVTNGIFAGPESSSTFSGFLLHPDSCDPASLRGPAPFWGPPEGDYSWDSMTGSATAPAEGGAN